MPWSFDIAAAPRGSYSLRAASNGKGHVKTFVREQIIAASACGVVNLSHYIPEEKRWCMYDAAHPPIAWMPWDGEKLTGKDANPPAHPTMATSWFRDLLRRAA